MKVIKYKYINKPTSVKNKFESKLVLEDETVVVVKHRAILPEDVRFLKVTPDCTHKSGWRAIVVGKPKEKAKRERKSITANEIFKSFEILPYKRFEIFASSYIMTKREINKLHAIIMDKYSFLNESKTYSREWLERILGGK